MKDIDGAPKSVPSFGEFRRLHEDRIRPVAEKLAKDMKMISDENIESYVEKVTKAAYFQLKQNPGSEVDETFIEKASRYADGF
jgi:hypothetical protein